MQPLSGFLRVVAQPLHMHSPHIDAKVAGKSWGWYKTALLRGADALLPIVSH
jgi:hypothetical protein